MLLKKLHILSALFFFSAILFAQTPDQQLEELYDRIMQADGFDEAIGYEILGQVYPEYQVVNEANRIYEQALAADDPAEITRLATQLAQRQYQPLQKLQVLIGQLRQYPRSDSTNRMLAALLLDYNHLQGGDELPSNEIFELLGAQDSTTLADPLDWIDPDLALEALLRRYRSPLPDQAPPEVLQQRLSGLQHCLELLHFLRRSRTRDTERLALAATVPPLAHRALVLALQLDQVAPKDGWREVAFSLAEQAKATLLADHLQGYVTDREQLDWPPLAKQLRLARRLATENGTFFEKPQQLRTLIDQQLPGLDTWSSGGTEALAFDQLQARISEDEALLVSYFLLGEQGVVFYLDGNDIQINPFYWNQETQNALSTLRKEMQGADILQHPTQAYQRYTNAAYWLFENILLRPVLQPYDGNAKRLIILPDAALWDMPFSALLTAEAPRDRPSFSPNQLDYLIEKYSLSLAPSAQAWLQLQRGSTNPLNVAALAPEFGGDAVAIRAVCTSPLAALPHSQIEATTIAELTDGAAFLGQDARLQNLRASDYTVWHLATHACRHEDDPSQSAIFLQDGALTADAIARLPLNLQLVVLSACETQSGPYQSGEGVLSIGRAFLQGGAQSLVGSLWPVSDAATAKLMPLFYEALQNGQPTDAALQNAQLRFLEQQDRLTAHPHYWAGFVLVGHNPEFSVGGLGNMLWYLLAGGLFFVVVISRRR